jgi:translation initiation factor 6
MLIRLDFNGNSHLGIYCRTNDKIAFVEPLLPQEVLRKIKSTLKVTDVIELTVGGSPIIGSLMAINSYGLVIADFVEEDEIHRIEKNFKGEVLIIDDKFNAAGNNILVNDYGAIVHPSMKEETVKLIKTTMSVNVKKVAIAGLNTVGMAGTSTNKGVLCHPKLEMTEKKIIENMLGVEVKIGTVNHGMPYVGAGLVANINGAITGSLTTGVELHRIEDTLDLIGD